MHDHQGTHTHTSCTRIYMYTYTHTYAYTHRCHEAVRFPYQRMGVHVLGQIGQADHPVGHVLLKWVTKATGEEGDGVTGGQVVLHLGVIACDGQHLEDNVPGLQVGHRLSMQISAVWGERTIIGSPYLGKQPTITLVPRPYHNPRPQANHQPTITLIPRPSLITQCTIVLCAS